MSVALVFKKRKNGIASTSVAFQGAQVLAGDSSLHFHFEGTKASLLCALQLCLHTSLSTRSQPIIFGNVHRCLA
eukprot:1396334-Amphidinium_carterae.1